MFVLLCICVYVMQMVMEQCETEPRAFPSNHTLKQHITTHSNHWLEHSASIDHTVEHAAIELSIISSETNLILNLNIECILITSFHLSWKYSNVILSLIQILKKKYTSDQHIIKISTLKSETQLHHNITNQLTTSFDNTQNK